MKDSIILRYLTNLRVMFFLLVAIAIGIALQQNHFAPDRLRNIIIFKMSFYNLMNHVNLYTINHVYEGLTLDTYKYSPSFAILYAPFAVLPLKLNTVLWNILNAVVFFFAIKSLPFSDKKNLLLSGSACWK
jgi:hypothetical protein